MLFPSRYGVLISKNGAGPSGPAPFLLPHSHCVASAWRAARVRSGRPQGRCVVRRTGSGLQESAVERREGRLKQRKRARTEPGSPRGPGRERAPAPRAPSTSGSAGRISKQWEACPLYSPGQLPGRQPGAKKYQKSANTGAAAGPRFDCKSIGGDRGDLLALWRDF